MEYLEHNQIAEELMTKWSELEPERCSKIKGHCPGYFYQIHYDQLHKGRRHWDFDFDFNPSRFRNEQYQFALLHWMLYEAICDRNWKASSTISSEGIQGTVTATFSTSTCSHPNPAIALLQAYERVLRVYRKNQLMRIMKRGLSCTVSSIKKTELLASGRDKYILSSVIAPEKKPRLMPSN